MASAVDTLISRANKKYGKDTLIRGTALKGWVLPRATTGSLALDVMLGGGWPLNQWNELVGNESNGKTVVALKTIAANMAANPEYEALWVASESFDPEWAETLGVDLDRLILATTVVMEEAYEIIVDALDNRTVDGIVVDSLPALIPTSEDEKAMDEFTVGLAARLTGQLVRKSGSAGKRSMTEEDRDCLVLFINQWRMKIGVRYGDPRTTPGGMGKNYKYFTRVEVARDEWIKHGDDKVGMTIKARTIKNKTAPPQRVGLVDFYFTDDSPFVAGEYDTFKEAFNLALAYDVITRRGAYYDFEGQSWQGKEALLQGLREDVDLRKKVADSVFSIVDTKARSHV